MAVLVEGISVITRISAIVERYPGGWIAFCDNAPNRTLCADSNLARVGFMSPNDVASFVQELEKRGLVFVANGVTQDIAVVDQQGGFTANCNWAVFRFATLDDKRVSVCTAQGDTTTILNLPDGWQYEGSLSQSFGFVPNESVDRTLKLLRRDPGLDTYYNTLEDAVMYTGRTNGR